MKPILTVSLFSFLALSALFAEDEFSVIPGVSVKVEVPYDIILSGERFIALQTVVNASAQDLPFVERGFGEGVQVFWLLLDDAGNRVPEALSLALRAVGRFDESPADFFRMDRFQDEQIRMLKPKEQISNERLVTHALPYGYIDHGDGPHSYQPMFYFKEAGIAYGPPVSVRICKQHFQDFPVVFRHTYSSSNVEHKFHEVELEGERYLYNMTGFRFCRIPPGLTYTIEAYEKTEDDYIMVKLSDPALEPVITSSRHYKHISGPRVAIPWLFNKPETAANQNPDETAMLLPRGNGTSGSGRPAPQKPEQEAAWGLLGWAFGLAGALAVIFFLCRKFGQSLAD